MSVNHSPPLRPIRAGLLTIKRCRYKINRKMTSKDACPMMSGGGGIRTPEEFPLAGFQDRCNQPDSATPPNRSIC